VEPPFAPQRTEEGTHDLGQDWNARQRERRDPRRRGIVSRSGRGRVPSCPSGAQYRVAGSRRTGQWTREGATYRVIGINNSNDGQLTVLPAGIGDRAAAS